MAVTLVLETGEGLANANSYGSVAEADAFHESNYHSNNWPAAEEDKAKLLITATRILDQQWQWFGFKATATQALQWPRVHVPDPDRVSFGGLAPVFNLAYRTTVYLESNVIPKFLKNALFQFARHLITSNTEAVPEGQGIDSFALEQVFEVVFDQSTKANIIPDWLHSELSKYGSPIYGGFKTVKLLRT